MVLELFVFVEIFLIIFSLTSLFIVEVYIIFNMLHSSSFRSQHSRLMVTITDVEATFRTKSTRETSECRSARTKCAIAIQFLTAHISERNYISIINIYIKDFIVRALNEGINDEERVDRKKERSEKCKVI